MIPNITEQELSELGFVKSIKNQWIGWFDYYLDTINPEYGHYLQVTIHIPRTSEWGGEMLTKILIHRYYNNEDPKINYSLRENESEQIYLGQIRSKEHLKQLLIDLFINKDEK